MPEEQEPYQLPGESLSQYADRLWHLIMSIEETYGQSTLQSEQYRMLLFVIEMQLLLEEEFNVTRLPPPSRDRGYPRFICLARFPNN